MYRYNFFFVLSLLFAFNVFASTKDDWLVPTGSTGGYLPSTSIATPGGYSGDWLTASGSLSTINRVRYDDFSDGALNLGLGLGDHQNIVGLSLSVTFFDLFGEQLGEASSLSVAISRHLGKGFSLGLGAQNLVSFGENTGDFVLPSYYVALSKGFQLSTSNWFNFLHFNVGVGNGSFNAESIANDILRGTKENFENINVFAAISLSIHSQVNLIGEYSGQNVNGGLNFLLFESINLNAGISALDLLDISGDGVRLGFQLTYSHQFGRQ